MPRPPQSNSPRGQRPEFPHVDRNDPPIKRRGAEGAHADPDEGGGNVIPAGERVADKSHPSDEEDEEEPLPAIYSDPTLLGEEGAKSEMNVAALQRKTMKELLDLAREEQVSE